MDEPHHGHPVRLEWSLGLTPGWASGQPATLLEQELITACLAAHTNKYGRHVSFSIQGRDALGTPIPVDLQEFTTFAQREACFFGNIFNGEGVYAGSDGQLSSDSSSVRACGLAAGDQCSPIHHVDPCADICKPDPSGNSYETCTYNGKTYRAITTRIRASDINRLWRWGLPGQRVLWNGVQAGQLHGLRALPMKSSDM